MEIKTDVFIIIQSVVVTIRGNSKFGFIFQRLKVLLDLVDCLLFHLCF